MICPTCKGARELTIVHVKTVDGRHLTADQLGELSQCFDCHGTGEVPDERRARIEAGAKMKEWRLKVAKRGLREEAEHRGMLPSVYYAMESGRIEPVFSEEMKQPCAG